MPANHDRWRLAITAYAGKFKDAPTSVGLPESKLDLATSLLFEAVKTGQPFESDEAWYKALGLDAPPAGALV